MDHRCRSCGKPLPPDFARPLCVACAFGNALEGTVDGSLPGESTGLGQALKTVVGAPAGAGRREEFTAQSFGEYELLEEIGRGAMGVVYRARQHSLNRSVAIKRILPGIRPSGATIRRFHAEAEAAARLRHPRIVGIHDIGEHDGQPFFSMEFVDGRPMSALLSDGPLPARQAAEYVFKIAEAVDYAHERGVVHRDLKPSNILIDASGEPLVTDFGLAKRLWAESDLTLSGQVLGTPSFMAPEQASSKDGMVGRWSDIYSLGAILYHAATGRPPFQAASTEATLREVLFNDPVAPKSLNPSLPLDLQTICLKCLEKEPSRRYGTARELADDLNRFLKDEPIRARPLSTPEKLWRWSRRKPVVASLAASVTLLLIAIAVGSTLSAYRISNSLQAERRENYFNGIARAYNFIQDNQFNRARAILNDENSASYRGWEWGHLQWLCHQDSMTLKDGGHWPLALAFSPDERFLALTTLNRKLKVWNATTGKLQFEVEAHRGEVSGLAFRSDGQRVLTCFRFDSEVKVWDLQTGAQVTSFRTEVAYPFRLAASRDGRWLAISGRKTVELRNAQTYELVTNLTGHGDVVIALAFSPNSGTLASGGGNIFPDETSKDGSIVLWDLETGQAKRRLPGHADTVRGLAFSRDGRRLASIGLSRDSRRWGSMGIGGTMRLWDVETGELIHDFGTAIHEDRRWTFDVGFEVAFCRGDKYLVSTHLDSRIRLWNAETGTEVRGLNGHTTLVHAMAMGHGGEKFASGAYDNTVKLWSLDNVFAPRELTEHDQPVWALSFSPDSHRLATGSWDGTARIWNPKTGALKLSIPVGFPVVSLDFSPDGRRLATVGRNFVALVWDASQGAQLLELKGHSNTVLSVAYSPSGTRIATGSKDRTIRLWDAESGQLQAVLVGHEGWVHDLHFSPDNRRLVSASGDDTVRLWDVKSGRLLRTLPGHSRDALCARFSPDGRWIASGGSDQTVRIWDAESGQLQRELTGHRLQGVVKSLAWSPDNRRLATATSEVILYRPTNRDFAIRMWDVETGRELLALKGHTDIVYALALSDDGRYLVGADADSVVRLFPSFPWRKPDDVSDDSSSAEWMEQWKRDFRRQQSLEMQAEQKARNTDHKAKNQIVAQRTESLAISERSPFAQAGMLDLTGFYNASLDHDWAPYWRLDHLDQNLSELPQGIQKFLDVEFDVRGIVQLRSIEPGWERYPERVAGIPVGRKISTLHALHGTAFYEAQGEIVAAYILNYADGTSAELPVQYGTDVWDWANRWGYKPPEEVRVAWQAPNPARPVKNAFKYLCQSVWENPHPDKVVESIDFVSKMARSAPFVIAMTIE